MKNPLFIIALLLLLVGGACTKSGTSFPNHTSQVGDTTFDGNFIQLSINGTYYNEKGIKIPVKGSIVQLNDRYGNTTVDSICLTTIDSFGTYGLGGDAATKYIAELISFHCKNYTTGTFHISQAEINQFHPSVHYALDNSGTGGVVNIFHNNSDFIQGTYSCPFTAGGALYTATGNFKVYRY